MRVRATRKVMFQGDWKNPGEEFDTSNGDQKTIDGYLASGVLVAVRAVQATARTAEKEETAAPPLSAATTRRRYARRDMEAAKK